MTSDKARILLTGGLGYIGSHTYLALLEAGYEVTIIDNFHNSSRLVLERLAHLGGESVDFVECDVRNKQHITQLFKDRNFKAVVHFAAWKAVGESVEQSIAYFGNNIGGLLNLLDVMAQFDVKRMVFSSSATVYGEPQYLPIDEAHPTSSTNPYGYTKKSSEEILGQVKDSNPEWNFGILRYFNPVGAHRSGEIGESPLGKPANLVPFVGDVAVGKRDKVVVFGSDFDTPDGTGVRDYIHIEDLAEGHVASLNLLLHKDQSHKVNLGTGKGLSVLEVIETYSRVSGQEIPFTIGDRRAGDIAQCYANCDAAKSVLGFEAKRSIEEMCRSSWQWVSKNYVAVGNTTEDTI